MKKLTCCMCWFAVAMFAVAIVHAQQTGGGAAGSAAAQQEQAAPEPTLPGQPQGATGAGQNQLPQPGAPREQAGQLLQPQQPGIETRQNVVTPSNRFGQQRGLNFQGGAPDPMPTPAERQAMGLQGEAEAGRQGQPMGAAAGQRGELGVWLAVSAGPGVEIRQVNEGTAAAEIGLQRGDVILEIDRRGVTSPLEVQQIIRAIPAGQTAQLVIWRNGEQQEVSVTLQPMREQYRSGYRGEGLSQTNGDLESRTMRLEEQLNMVMRELEQIRGEMARLHPEMTSQPAGAGIGVEQPARQPQPGPFDIEATETEPAEPDPTAIPPAEPQQPAPPATEPEPPATEPAEEPAEDLFGGEPAETESEETTPEETQPQETETETNTDSLFE